MKTFKSFLMEGTGPDFAPWHMRDPAEIRNKFGALLTNAGLTINKNGTLSCRQGYTRISGIFLNDSGQMQFKLQTTNECRIQTEKLTSVWGAPSKCKELVIQATDLTSLEHLDAKISGTLFIGCPKLTEFNCKVSANGLFFDKMNMSSLKNINRYFDIQKYMTFNLGLIDTFKSNILSILLIKNLREVKCQNSPKIHPFVNALEIINKHVQGDKDVLECQEEMISNGFKEFAKL